MKILSNYMQNLKNSAKEQKSTKNIVFCALMAALAVILSYIATIQIGNYIRIGFSELPNRVVDCLFGPVVGSILGAVTDIIKYVCKPTGPYFFGFTISSVLNGFIYGCSFYKKNLTLFRVILTNLFVKVLVDCTLNTLWLSMLYGKGFTILLPLRALKSLIMWPIDSFIIFVMLTAIYKSFSKLSFSFSHPMKQ